MGQGTWSPKPCLPRPLLCSSRGPQISLAPLLSTKQVPAFTDPTLWPVPTLSASPQAPQTRNPGNSPFGQGAGPVLTPQRLLPLGLHSPQETLCLLQGLPAAPTTASSHDDMTVTIPEKITGQQGDMRLPTSEMYLDSAVTVRRVRCTHISRKFFLIEGSYQISAGSLPMVSPQA